MSAVPRDRRFLDRLATRILAFEGDSRVGWFEGAVEAYEEDKIRRLDRDTVESQRTEYKKFER